MLIDGSWVDSASGKEISVNLREPPNHRRHSTRWRQDVDRAVQAASKAFASWSCVIPRERGRMLQKIADAIEGRVEELARIVAEETGNAIRPQARPEVKGAADVFRYFGGLASELKGETIPLGEHVLSYTRREPIGVVGAIVPWNAPVCSARSKSPWPWPQATRWCSRPPRTRRSRCCGWRRSAGASAARRPQSDHRLRRGMRRRARRVILWSASCPSPDRPKSARASCMPPRTASCRCHWSLEARAPPLVFPDADDDGTVDGVIAGMRVTRQGQSCTAGSRLFLHRSIFESFLAKLADKLAAFKIGDPLDEATDMGAIISRKQFRPRLRLHRRRAAAAGRSLVLGGLPPQDGPLAQGYFVSRRCSPMSGTIGGLRERRFSAP